ncbi:alkaline phosphatase D family protein [Salegentibacter sp. T436]|uniref:alkaline phosphatase D family protein n=1 Tax=Salegentibacter sp. T436 TaxID=1729720 RepID=UPI00094A668B|nr:alkaline phosphatase D family protein [Salegentibacter sp. T436]APS40582.1 hypothetical protein AO058_17625 [Salegentibacter sp. T436]
MNRRENLKSILLGGLSASLLSKNVFADEIRESINLTDQKLPDHLNSDWHRMPDMNWAGPNYWTNRLQDFRIRNGALECIFQGENRTVHHLTLQMGNSRNSFTSSIEVKFSEHLTASAQNKIGFVLGAKSWNFEYRASAVHGDGFRIGINTLGNIFIGREEFNEATVQESHLKEGVVLEVRAEPLGMDYLLSVRVLDKMGGMLAFAEKTGVQSELLVGNIALLSHFEKITEGQADGIVCSFNKWSLQGDKLMYNGDQFFGPICFTQYTRENKIVKLTAQLCPVALPSKVRFEINQGDGWMKIDEASVQYPSYTAQFRFGNWPYKESLPFRVVYDLIGTDGTRKVFHWEGTIAKEPTDKNLIKALVCSCNHDRGFPDQDIVEYAGMHEPDLIMFLGDQFYEINGHFGFQKAPLEKAYLDYLRKWYMFGWSYRELFKNIPVINLPDDHDVFQGNLFGANGIEFPKASIGARFKRDFGGFMMPPEWVNLAMTTQTSHMPDPYDSTPIDRGIHVFYSNWNYAGISFGIVEDRKFKSGPAAILPPEAGVRDAFIENPEYPIKSYGYPEADLLGKRQMDFLKEWVEDWGENIEFKILVSATPFHALQTMPDEKSNGMQRQLEVPETGDYVQGDVPVADMDTGGWPQYERDEVIKTIRKSYSLHLAGDQHLPSVSQYGVKNYQDGGYTFAVPALANSWPRRWWPSIKQPIEGEPKYTGNHEDAFGNKMYVRAVANPSKTGLKPSNLYDWSPGYGVVSFDKNTRNVKMECWPRYVNPVKKPNGQFRGWPVTVHQLENNKPTTPFLLPTLKFKGLKNPLVKIIDDKKETQLILRVNNEKFQPIMEREGIFALQVIDAAGNILTQIEGLSSIASTNDKVMEISV